MIAIRYPALRMTSPNPAMQSAPLEINKRKEDFIRSVRRLRFVSILAFAMSGVAMIGIGYAASPYSRQIKTFFDNHIGGDLGDGLRGLSIAVVGSLPMIVAFMYIRRREMLLDYRCPNCSRSLTTYWVAESVARENQCPECDTMVFSSGDDSKSGGLAG